MAWENWLVDTLVEENKVNDSEEQERTGLTDNAAGGTILVEELTPDDFAVLDTEDGWFMHADSWTYQERVAHDPDVDQIHSTLRNGSDASTK